MENKDGIEFASVPYAYLKGVEVKHERIVKWLIAAIILAFLLGFASGFAHNALWLHAWCQYDTVDTDETSQSESVEVDAGGGTANYFNDTGDVINGENNSQTNNNPQENTNQNEKGQ